jgi:hypothetical protein
LVGTLVEGASAFGHDGRRIPLRYPSRRERVLEQERQAAAFAGIERQTKTMPEAWRQPAVLTQEALEEACNRLLGSLPSALH